MEEIKWERKWFGKNYQYNPHYWTNKENQRKFLEEFAKKNNFTSPKDWGKVRIAQIVREASFISNYYQNSLKAALASLFPGLYLFPVMKRC